MFDRALMARPTRHTRDFAMRTCAQASFPVPVFSPLAPSVAAHSKRALAYPSPQSAQELEERYKFLSSPHQMVTSATDFDKVIVAERGDLLFVFNFHVTKDYEGYIVPCPEPGTWHCIMDSDEVRFGGEGRVGLDTDHYTNPEAPETWVGAYVQPKRACALIVRSPPRSMQARRGLVEPGSLASPASVHSPRLALERDPLASIVPLPH